MPDIEEVKEEILTEVETRLEAAEENAEVANAEARADLTATTAAIALAQANADVQEARETAAELVAEAREENQESIEWLRNRVQNLEVSLMEKTQEVEQLRAQLIPLASAQLDPNPEIIQVETEPTTEPEVNQTTETEAAPETSPSGAADPLGLEKASEAVQEVLETPVIRFL